MVFSFLVVALQIDAILGEVTIGGRRRKLREMTSGLRDAYTATLSRIRGQRGALARYGISALMWISFAERPLLIDELCHALAVEIEPPDFDPEMVPTIETIVASCMGLVTIDYASYTARLVHATLEEYLCSHRDNVFRDTHATMAEVCLSYLSIASARGILPNLETVPSEFALLGYASCYWGAHARKEFTVRVRQLAIGILDNIQHVVGNIHLPLEDDSDMWCWGSSSTSGLHYLAYFGMNEILETLLRMGQGNLNQTDWWGRTPLHLAARGGNEGMVKTLLRCADVDPNAQDEDGNTPLHTASGNNHEGVVRILLSRPDVDPDSLNHVGETPLFHAAGGGHEKVARILLSRADPNLVSVEHSRTAPLLQASIRGHEAVMRVLLSHANIKPNLANRAGQTPLHAASEEGREELLRILLSRDDVNPNLTNMWGQTPLSEASELGYEGVVRILLSRADVNPNLAGWSNQTPLLRAAVSGHEGVVRILLSRTDVDPNLPNCEGLTPLSLAATMKGWRPHKATPMPAPT